MTAIPVLTLAKTDQKLAGIVLVLRCQLQGHPANFMVPFLHNSISKTELLVG
jgi:hypothetical protein